MATENKKYKRVMLKLSGEAMASDKGFGIDNSRLGCSAARCPR